ncbi:MAG TPA: coproporphyrinogen III oxidase [Nitrospiraceae bacterium]|nr:coproporphyrinogen III oxidase [Nitrospiraceae bacterium]
MLSLYIHIPFCVKKCLYCGFYSTPYTADSADSFVSALGLEAARSRDRFSDRIFDTLYIGGGTPTALSCGQLELVFRTIREQFRISGDAECTVEANPNSITSEGLALLIDIGVNRLSIGVQSFSEGILRTLGRLHTAEEAAEAVRQARSAGFRNIGIDLIYGVPGQTCSDWKHSLESALALTPEHISVYGLSLDEGTWFASEAEAGRLLLPDDEAVVTMSAFAVAALMEAGYGHYEISNFARPGFACRHNVNYWERGAYLGIGPGASSFLDGRRFSNSMDNEEYCRRLHAGLSSVVMSETIEPSQAAAEAVMLGLRMEKGVDLARFGQEHGASALECLTSKGKRLAHSGLASLSPGRLRLTEHGMQLSDSVIARLTA